MPAKKYFTDEERIEANRKRDRENKKWHRKHNTPYAKSMRAWKRSPQALAAKRKKRHTKEGRAKEAAYAKRRRKLAIVRHKDKIRVLANIALSEGKIVRPERCEICNRKPKPLHDGRTGLRMDHYKGYSKEFALTVRFICVKCDSKSQRKHKE